MSNILLCKIFCDRINGCLFLVLYISIMILFILKIESNNYINLSKSMKVYVQTTDVM